MYAIFHHCLIVVVSNGYLVYSAYAFGILPTGLIRVLFVCRDIGCACTTLLLWLVNGNDQRVVIAGITLQIFYIRRTII